MHFTDASLFCPNVLFQVSSVFFPGKFQGFALVNRQRTNRISSGFTVEVSSDFTQLSYSNFDYLGQEPHYWQLPGAYQGDKVSNQRSSQTPSWCQKPVDRSYSVAVSALSFQADLCRFLSFLLLCLCLHLSLFLERVSLYSHKTRRTGTVLSSVSGCAALSVVFCAVLSGMWHF